MFVHNLRTRFHEADPAGIAFFGHVFVWCHEAYEELLASRGVLLSQLIEKREVGLPIAHAEADFQAPIVAGQTLRIEVKVARVGEKSFQLDYVVKGEDGGTHATATTVHVAIDPAVRKSTRLPDVMRDALRGV